MAIVILALIMLVCAAPIFLWQAALAQIAGMAGVPTPVIIGVWIVLVVIYFLPAINAHSRRHHNTTAIFILTFFLGWSFVFWVVALVWSFTADRAENINVYAVDHRLYDPPMRDVTYTHTALTADAADRIGHRHGAGMWTFGLALIIVVAGAFIVGKAFISTALIDDGAAKPATITAQAAKPTAIEKAVPVAASTRARRSER
jgi:hypothetical protein